MIAFDVDPDMYNKHKFDAPDTLLKAVVSSLKSSSTQNKAANINNTDRVARSNLKQSSNIHTIDDVDDDVMDSQVRI